MINFHKQKIYNITLIYFVFNFYFKDHEFRWYYISLYDLIVTRYCRPAFVGLLLILWSSCEIIVSTYFNKYNLYYSEN